MTADHDVTDVMNGTEARFHGSSVSGTTTKTWRPGLSSFQPTAYAANRTREREVGRGREAGERDADAPDHCAWSHLHVCTVADFSGVVGVSTGNYTFVVTHET